MDVQPSDFFSGLQKLEQRARKGIELRGEWVEYIPGLVSVTCFLPGRAKDLSAPPRDVWTGINLPFFKNNIILIINDSSFRMTSSYLSAYDAVSVGNWVDLGVLYP